MAKKQPATRKRTRSKRGNQQQPDAGTGKNGHENQSYEQELADYLLERIKPGLNRGAIPLLARSIAKELAHRGAGANGGAGNDAGDDADADIPGAAEDDARGDADEDFDEEDGEVRGDADEDFDEDFDEEDGEVRGDADEGEFDDDQSDAAADVEGELRDLQAELGDNWILRFSVQGDDTWLTAETEDGSQHVEAPDPGVLADVVDLLNTSGGRSS
jgi:hypothetical protein